MSNRFEDLRVWIKAYGLSVQIYKVLRECKDYGLKDQMTRAAVSIPSNIAEGFERGTNKEFIRYLIIAKGSAGELRTQLNIAKDINYISETKSTELIKEVTEISYMLSSLISKRKSFIPSTRAKKL